jgi:hypothetical protein
MHTDITLKIFNDVTTNIGAEFCTFEYKTCSAFDTQELAREFKAWKDCQQNKQAGGQVSVLVDTSDDLYDLDKVHTKKIQPLNS